MKILITGARGFVGSHLTRELREFGYEVIPSDIQDSDLAVAERGERLIREHRPDYVAHLAARYGRLLCRDEPHRAVADNTASTTEIAAVCAELDIPVLYASSSEVYGDHGTLTISEDSELRMPTTIYGLSKRWGEEALRLYLPPEKRLIVRMNMLYGPEQLGGYGRCSLATFIRNALDGEPFTVHRNTTRSWLYISDAVRALRILIEQGHRGIFNLGNPAGALPMVKVGEMVCEQTGGLMQLAETPEGQIAHKHYDCSKLLSVADWEPEISLKEGIRRTIEWAREEVPIAA